MSVSVSTNYRQLRPDEVEAVAQECQHAWADPAIPRRQYELAVKPELDKYRRGEPVAPYDALVKCLRQIPLKYTGVRSKILDVGCSSGYYRAVLRMSGYFMQYTACDFSPEFKELAEELYPDMAFGVADARHLPHHDDFFEVVLNSAVIMHVAEYEQVIRETARVAKNYAIFHRTPIVDGPTKYYVKDAYSVPCIEIHFNERELRGIFDSNGLTLIHSEDVFREGSFGHRSYLLAKAEALNHVQV